MTKYVVELDDAQRRLFDQTFPGLILETLPEEEKKESAPSVDTATAPETPAATEEKKEETPTAGTPGTGETAPSQ